MLQLRQLKSAEISLARAQLRKRATWFSRLRRSATLTARTDSNTNCLQCQYCRHQLHVDVGGASWRTPVSHSGQCQQKGPLNIIGALHRCRGQLLRAKATVSLAGSKASTDIYVYSKRSYRCLHACPASSPCVVPITPFSLSSIAKSRQSINSAHSYTTQDATNMYNNIYHALSRSGRIPLVACLAAFYALSCMLDTRI